MPRKQKKYHYLYKTTNLINDKFYVGMHSTDDLNDGYLGSGKHLRNSINYYGKQNFKFEILEFFNSREILIEEEEKLVDRDFIKDPLCMNLRIGGHGAFPFHTFNLGSKRTEETKIKMGEWIRTDEYKIKISEANLGKIRTDEHKEKYHNCKIGKKHSEASKLNMSEVMKGKNKGKKHSEASKLNMSEAHKGKKLSDEHKNKISEGNLLKDWQIEIIKNNIGKMSYRKIGTLAKCMHTTVSRTIKRLNL